MENEDWIIPIHDACGLPAELCVCPDAPVKFDPETGMFIDMRKEAE
jgi:hypothetical protein